MKVCIDPGHGLPDPGALGQTANEADINLSIAHKLKEALLCMGIEVVLTREGTERIAAESYGEDLKARCTIASQSNADLFLSIHCSLSGIGCHSIQTYFCGHGSESEKFAKAVHAAALDYTHGTNRGIKTAGFFILRTVQIPAALIELPSLSKPEEEANLINTTWQTGLAEALAKGICHYTSILKTENRK